MTGGPEMMVEVQAVVTRIFIETIFILFRIIPRQYMYNGG